VELVESSADKGVGVVPPTADSEIDEGRCESKPRVLERVCGRLGVLGEPCFNAWQV
jgi:hypothetical protein